MGWTLCQGPTAFLEQRGGYLKANESLCCLAWAAVLRSQQTASASQDYAFYVYRADGCATAHAFIRFSRQTLNLSPMPQGIAKQLAQSFSPNAPEIHIVEGPKDTAIGFSTAWERETGTPCTTVMQQGLYELTEVVMPTTVAGHILRATQEHEPKLQDYLAEFCRECFPNNVFTSDMTAQRVSRLLREQNGYLWINQYGVPVSMAAIVRESPNTASISLVYTPPKHRRCGYAARLVATLSQAQLDSGKSACNLHTDLENPTSNGVYTRIGYKKIAESIRVRISKNEK